MPRSAPRKAGDRGRHGIVIGSEAPGRTDPRTGRFGRLFCHPDSQRKSTEHRCSDTLTIVMAIPEGTHRFAVLEFDRYGRTSWIMLVEIEPGRWQQWVMVKEPPLRNGVTRLAQQRGDVEIADVPVSTWDSGPCTVERLDYDTMRIGFGGRRLFGDYVWVTPRPGFAMFRRGLGRIHDGRFALSAGGIVIRDEDPAAILIRPRGRDYWTLPKGTVEDGEAVEDAAVREVEEETGIHGEIIAPLDPIEYWFWSHDGGRRIRIHKLVAYYLMRPLREGEPTAEKEIDEARWFAIDDAPSQLSHGSERDVLEQGIAAWREVVAR
ncbi:MAG: NUDIX hydrolase [Candidatus Dadabacteria bacterium]|nr:MAG: NUDIX hydrolase [Candidatus Dadabacteria bacterium]